MNRIDEIILFNRLTKNEIQKIIQIQIEELRKLLKRKKIKIKLIKMPKIGLSNEGFSTSYGARPLKRLIQTEIRIKLH